MRYDIAVPGPNGDEFELRYWTPVNSSILDANGRLLYILNAVDDVTDVVRLQDRESQRESAAVEIRRRTANISHDLRNPLNAIIGFAELMIDDAGQRYSAEKRQFYLDRIHASGKRLLGLVDEVMMLTTDHANLMESGAEVPTGTANG